MKLKRRALPPAVAHLVLVRPMRALCLRSLSIACALICARLLQAEEPYPVQMSGYNIPVRVDGRPFTASATYIRFSNGARDYSSVLAFPDPEYLVHTTGVVQGITTWSAHGYTYRIGGRHVVITDHTFAWLKVLSDEVPAKAYASASSLRVALDKILKRH
jgi:hypothetical protein